MLCHLWPDKLLVRGDLLQVWLRVFNVHMWKLCKCYDVLSEGWSKVSDHLEWKSWFKKFQACYGKNLAAFLKEILNNDSNKVN